MNSAEVVKLILANGWRLVRIRAATIIFGTHSKPGS